MIKITCQQCKKEFKVVPSKAKRTKFCSFKCKKQGMKGKIWGYKFPKGKPSWNKGRHFSEKSKTKMREAKKINPTRYWLGKKGNQIKENHWNWKGGISENPYPQEFNAKLKLKIRTRDNFTCVLCGKTEREELEELNRVLSVNHIDFDKNNCKEKNLNTLCLRCNVKINRERDYWINYFKIL